jgi:[ribosomal protein S5]-alanine N-acetyltransferase
LFAAASVNFGVRRLDGIFQSRQKSGVKPPHSKSKEMFTLETERLTLRHLSPETDAEFILRLLNESSFLEYIGDKKVRTLDDARGYMRNGPMKSYEENGFGLYRVALKEDDRAIGICGLIKRDTLPEPDIGFAFLPEYWDKGYAHESAAEVMRHAREVLRLDCILAITTPDNEPSAKLLGKIGLGFQRMIRLSDEADEVKLFSTDNKPSEP